MNASTMIARWTSPERPLFKGKLIDDTGCKCAQGDVLACSGVTDAELRRMEQSVADNRTAELLGISRFHSILLRTINDRADGCPQAVLTASGLRRILGPHWRLVLAFGRHLDTLDVAGWDKVCAAWAAAWDAAWAAAWAAAGAAAGAAAWAAAGAAAGAAAWDAAWAAAGELVGWSRLAEPFFIRMFFPNPAAWVADHEHDRDPGIVED